MFFIDLTFFVTSTVQLSQPMTGVPSSDNCMVLQLLQPMTHVPSSDNCMVLQLLQPMTRVPSSDNCMVLQLSQPMTRVPSSDKYFCSFRTCMFSPNGMEPKPTGKHCKIFHQTKFLGASTFSRVGNSIIGFSRESLVCFFVIKRGKEHSLVKKSQSLLSLFFKVKQDRFAHGRSFFKKQQDQFTHGRSFLKSDEIDSLTVALF